LWVIFALLDPDPDPLTRLNPDPQPCLQAYLDRVQLAEYGYYNTSSLNYNVAANSGETFHYLTGGAGCVVVEVDCRTGNHAVLRTDIVMDCGQSINPAIDIGQIEGAFLQGELIKVESASVTGH
jgi:xanthine dehydrogenase molybdopterin-binding subunit B